MHKGMAHKIKSKREKRTDVIWAIRQQEVLDEMAKAMGVEEVTTTNRAWFKWRTTICSAILHKMTPEERITLDAEVTRRAKEGLDEPQQRR